MALTVRIVPPAGVEGFEDDPELVVSFDAPRVVIGRGAGCDLVLPDPTVSARHASIRQRNAKYVIFDEGSTNGILVGTVKLPAQTPGPLRERQLVRVGRIWLEICCGVGCVDPARKADTIAHRLVRRQLRAAGELACPVLRVVSGPDAGASWPLEEPGREVVVGRSRQSDWTLGDEELSRRHFAACLRGADVYVWDLNSKRGSSLAGKPLGTEPQRWPTGAEVVVGHSVIELADPVPEALEELLGSPDETMRAAEFAEPPPRTADRPSLAQSMTPPEEPEGGENADAAGNEAAEPSSGHDASGAAVAEETDGAGDGDDVESSGRHDVAPSTEGAGGRLVELVVVLVALAVIAVSLIGLLMLLRR